MKDDLSCSNALIMVGYLDTSYEHILHSCSQDHFFLKPHTW
jgi:hypothetical protein